jgi:hypothetical protein
MGQDMLYNIFKMYQNCALQLANNTHASYKENKCNGITSPHMRFKNIYKLQGVHKWLDVSYAFYDYTYIRLQYGYS